MSAFTSAEKGKAKEVVSTESLTSHDNKKRSTQTRDRTLLRFNAQKSPFHSSEVGSLASRQPAAVSVGIFQPEYPFRPSGRRKVRGEDSRRRSRGARSPDDYSDLRAETVPYESLFNVPQSILEDDILKHGWTRSMLDDDARLAVPDDARRPRGDSAIMQAKKLLGKNLYRWQPGQGYVLSRYKDYSSYKRGPGIALGQLLPPREHAYTPALPFIPNDSKRDLAWMVVWWIAALAFLTIFMEARSVLRRTRKGKRKEINASDNGVPSIRLFNNDDSPPMLDETDEDEASSPVHTSSFQQFYLNTNTRQRTQARNFREICKAALFPNASVSTPSMAGAVKWSILGGSNGNNLTNGHASQHKDAPSYVLQDVAWPKKEIGRNANGSADQGKRAARTRNVDPKDAVNISGSRDDMLLSPPTKNRPPARRAVTQAYPAYHNRAMSGRSIIQSASHLFGGGGGVGGGGGSVKGGPSQRRDS
jgi:hypothetical protein